MREETLTEPSDEAPVSAGAPLSTGAPVSAAAAVPAPTSPSASVHITTGPGLPERTPAWRPADLANPHADPDKPAKVREMFAAIARSYDLNNRVHSLWMDQLWRAHAVREAAVKPGDHVLDVACGTGDLTQAFARHTQAATIIGVDFTDAMLDLARAKQQRLRHGLAGRIEYKWGDAQRLDYPAKSFDVVSIAFGIRNVREPERAIAEFARVLRPGGRLVILEFDTPRVPPVRWFNDFYAGWVMPRTATIISGDRSGAYRYLPRSVQTFMPRAKLVETLHNAGFMNAAVRTLSLGICACYRAIRKT